jgi:hypothetical protein
MSDKIFDAMYVSASNSGNWNLNVSYRLDGTDTAWTNKLCLLTNGYGYIVSKIPFTMDEPMQGRYIQFKIGNNNKNEYYKFKKLITTFAVEPPL